MNEIITVITGQTKSTGDIVGAAFIRNWNADSCVVEDPISGALLANSTLPDLASGISNSSSV